MATPESLTMDTTSAKSSPGKVWCTYCGKRFTRKEHLERHLPTHTNVKPYRCSACTLGFTRRDLLQRHYTTYHEPRDSIEPPAGGFSSLAGRTQISCLTCANAKTGCDKKVPCTRCAEKNLPCEPRYARRSSKAAMRAAAAQIASSPQVSQYGGGHGTPGANLGMATKSEVGSSSSAIEVALPGMPRDDDVSSSRTTPQNTLSNFGDFPTQDTRMMGGGLDDYLSFGAALGLHLPPFTSHPYPTPSPHELPPQDFWMDFDMTLDAYPTPHTSSSSSLGATGLYMTPLPEFGSSPTPEFMSASEPSSRGSIQTSATSRLSTEPDDSCRGLGFASLTSTTGDATHDDDLKAVVLAEAAWNVARCNPLAPADSCPRTSLVHLECLEQRSKQEDTWTAFGQYLEQAEWGSSATESTAVVPLASSTRDKLLAITQSFLHKALEIHRGGMLAHHRYRDGFSSAGGGGGGGPGQFNFLVLPSSKILESCLHSHVRSMSTSYYPLVTGGRVDPNEMLEESRASTLLLLLMIAQGAAAMPVAEARYLSAGLTETCRISLFDLVEKDVELSGDPVTLRCALLFLLVGAWSGDKWLMDIAMGQRGMYMSMIKHAGMLESRALAMPELRDSASIGFWWHEWLQYETRNRLVYNYVMLDQELSLFHDTAPFFSITELQCSLPGPDLLWKSQTSEEWFAAMKQSLLRTTSTPISLHRLFQDFLQDDFLHRHPSLSPQHLRLLLHPLQSMVFHLRQMISCFPNDDELVEPSLSAGSNNNNNSSSSSSSNNPMMMMRQTILHQLRSVQALLQKWHTLAANHAKSDPDCMTTLCSLVLHHLIYLDTLTNFPEIERLARREGLTTAPSPSPWELAARHGRCIFQHADQAVLHCGQVFRLLKLIPQDRRPGWWPLAMYRATMVLWADSVGRRSIEPGLCGGGGQDKQQPCSTRRRIMIDQLESIDELMTATETVTTAGMMGLAASPDGSIVGLESPGDILSYTIKHLETCRGSRMGDGIARKLVELGNRWAAVEGMDLSPAATCLTTTTTGSGQM